MRPAEVERFEHTAERRYLRPVNVAPRVVMRAVGLQNRMSRAAAAGRRAGDIGKARRAQGSPADAIERIQGRVAAHHAGMRRHRHNCCKRRFGSGSPRRSPDSRSSGPARPTAAASIGELMSVLASPPTLAGRHQMQPRGAILGDDVAERGRTVHQIGDARRVGLVARCTLTLGEPSARSTSTTLARLASARASAMAVSVVPTLRALPITRRLRGRPLRLVERLGDLVDRDRPWRRRSRSRWLGGGARRGGGGQAFVRGRQVVSSTACGRLANAGRHGDGDAVPVCDGVAASAGGRLRRCQQRARDHECGGERKRSERRDQHHRDFLREIRHVRNRRPRNDAGVRRRRRNGVARGGLAVLAEGWTRTARVGPWPRVRARAIARPGRWWMRSAS